MGDERLWFTKNGERIEEGIDLRNGKANIGGWSTYEVWHNRGEAYPGAPDEQKIADLYCGEPINLAEGYGFLKEPVGG